MPPHCPRRRRPFLLLYLVFHAAALQEARSFMCTSILLQLYRCACAPFTRTDLCASGRATGYEGAAGRAYTDLDEVSFLDCLLLSSPLALVAIYFLLHTYPHHPLFLALSSLCPHPSSSHFSTQILTFPPSAYPPLRLAPSFYPPSRSSSLPSVHDLNTFSSQTLGRPLAVLLSGGRASTTNATSSYTPTRQAPLEDQYLQHHQRHLFLRHHHTQPVRHESRDAAHEGAPKAQAHH
ncbi:hypothetical protein B0H16DRAFT_1733015 [Mycena metata]|uniref:Uncharacterized protein n=1 Tax=Mycena metata TaxID=1033252 RepID=A0AAD7I1J5_9AGAR|nr:hypothetical protein B0H16DRAFT_1733015 [Mycena metata]